MAPSTPKSSKSRGTHFASNIIQNASKVKQMTQANLKNIGKSSNFHELLIAVAKDANRFLRPALEQALKACAEGENEDAAEKKARKAEMDAGIAKSNKVQARKAHKEQADTAHYIRKEWFGGPPAATTETEPCDPDTTFAIVHPESATQDASQDESSEVGDLDDRDNDTDMGDESTKSRDTERDATASMVEPTWSFNAVTKDNLSKIGNSNMNNTKSCPDEDSLADNSEHENDTDKDDTDEDEEMHESTEPSKYDRQMALIWGEPLPKDEEYCKIELAKLHFSARGSHNASSAFEELKENCIMKLDPEAARDELVEYLQNRLITAARTNLPTASASSSLEDILNVLHVLNGVTADAMIRCAYAQILLFRAVQQRVSENRKTPQGSHRAAHLNVLQEIAAKKAGGVSGRESTRIYKSYERDYYAGKNWVDVVDMFEGDAIVMVFILTGVGSWSVAHRFTEYQRACLIYISSHLYSIKILVNAIRPKALERYCRRGCLDESVVETVESVDLLEE